MPTGELLKFVGCFALELREKFLTTKFNVRLNSNFVQERDDELAREQQRQEENDVLRKQFAQAANAFHQWLTHTR